MAIFFPHILYIEIINFFTSFILFKTRKFCHFSCHDNSICLHKHMRIWKIYRINFCVISFLFYEKLLMNHEFRKKWKTVRSLEWYGTGIKRLEILQLRNIINNNYYLEDWRDSSLWRLCSKNRQFFVHFIETRIFVSALLHSH